MAIYRCTEDNQFDGMNAYRRGHRYTLSAVPPANKFDLIPAEVADKMPMDESPLPAQQDIQGDWHIFQNVQFEKDVEFTTLVAESLELCTDCEVKPWKAGQLQYDPGSFTFLLDSGIEGVRNNIGEETWYLAVNYNAEDIVNGTAVYANDTDPVTGEFFIFLAKADSIATSGATLGLATGTIPGTDSEPDPWKRIGLVTNFGAVRDFDTAHLLTTKAMWLSATTAGGLTSTKPLIGSQLILMGACQESDNENGRVWVEVNRTANSVPSYKSETFSSRGVGADTYYLFGNYLAPSTDVTLTQASLTLDLGTENAAYGMRPFAVFAGDGTVDSGTVGLRVNGTSITDGGLRTPGDTQIITTDITQLVDTYLTTPDKFIGALVYELYASSGSPTTYSVSFNYGLAKFEDFGNRDFVLTDIEVLGLGGANDSSAVISVEKYSEDGWTYSAAGFVPGNGVIASMNSIYATEDDIVSGEPFHFKLDSTALCTVIMGSESEGVIVRLVATQNNTFQILNCHLGVSF